MKKLFLTVFVFVILLIGCQAKEQNDSKNKYFFVSSFFDEATYGDSLLIAEVSKDKIQFFSRNFTENSKWQLAPDIEFVLPANTDYVYIDDEGPVILVAHDKKIQFYEFTDKWEEVPDLYLPLSTKIDDLIMLDGSVGVIANSQITFYVYNENNQWDQMEEFRLTLPNGYKYVEKMYYGIIVITTNNDIKYYEFDEEWKETTGLSFYLPNECNDILTLYDTILGFVFDDCIQIYFRNGNAWSFADGYDFEFTPINSAKTASGNSQNGYKEYTWGMSTDQVKSICPDLIVDNTIEEEFKRLNIKLDDTTRWKTPKYALMYLYKSDLINKIPEPLQYEYGKLSYYESDQNDLQFYFLNDKLIAVELTFRNENIISELKQRYGNVSPISGSLPVYYNYQTAAWDKEPNRIIVWEQGNTGIETVTYIDKKWLSPLLNKTIEVIKRGTSNTRNRLD
jgi:hypothetical protein